METAGCREVRMIPPQARSGFYKGWISNRGLLLVIVNNMQDPSTTYTLICLYESLLSSAGTATEQSASDRCCMIPPSGRQNLHIRELRFTEPMKFMSVAHRAKLNRSDPTNSPCCI